MIKTTYRGGKVLFWTFSLLAVLALVLSACQPAATPEPTPTETPAPSPTPAMAVQPSVTVMDQEITDSTVVVPEAVSEGPGWMVIHRNDDGAPGAVIGFAPVEDGVNENIEVEIDVEQATPTLYAMLHTDTGEVGAYEFPDADPPVSVDDQIVVEPFEVSGLAVTPAVTVTDQEITDSTVVVPEVVSDGPGWIVIHRDDDGAPGAVIGHAAVENGVNQDVEVEIDLANATETLHAMVHTDSGEVGTYEFPDGDPPAQVEGEIVVKPFTVSGLTFTPAVTVQEEDVSDGEVVIPEVVSDGPGWIVIHQQIEDQPGPVIGHAAVENGLNQDVAVEIPPGDVTQTLYAMVHNDTGQVGTYEFPDGDPPAQVEGEIVVEPFEVSGIPPSVIVDDQMPEDSTVIVPQVVSEGPGWVVMHRDDNGAPGAVIGHAAVEDGVNQEVEVEIDLDQATDTIYAMLHADAEEVGTYEFPGGDPPVEREGEIVVKPFELQMPEMVEVEMVGTSFQPEEITIQPGTTVRWINNSSLPHTVTADDGSFDSGTLSRGDTFEHTFEETGTVPYYCVFHGNAGGVGMSGTVIVQSQ